METDNTDKDKYQPVYYGRSIVTLLNEQIDQHRKFWLEIRDSEMFTSRKEIYEQSEPDAGRPIHTSDD